MKAPDVASSVDPAPTLRLLLRSSGSRLLTSTTSSNPNGSIPASSPVYEEQFSHVGLSPLILMCYLKQLDLFCAANTTAQY